MDLVDDLGKAHGDAPKTPEPKGNADVPTLAEQELPQPTSVPETVAPDALPPEWRSERAVLCIAGRGPLDEAAATILAQLLGKHGLSAGAVSYDRVSRRGIESLDLGGVAMVCIAYLEVKGNPSHLRYLLQRLKERLPHGKLLVGLWPENESVLSDTALQREIGADIYVSTLQQSVEACLAEARATAKLAA